MTVPPPGYAPYPGQPPQEDTVLSVLAHLSYFAFGFVGPLILWLVVKDDPAKQMTRYHALEALNFHITITIVCVVSIPLVFVIVGIFTFIAAIVGGAILAIVAAVAAGRREPYRYPLTLRLVH